MAVVVQLEGDVLDEKGPDLVAESVRVEAPLRNERTVVSLARCSWAVEDWEGASFDVLTLKDRRYLTFFWSASVMAWSKLLRIFIASCGLMRSSLIRSSSVSVRARPMLVERRKPPELANLVPHRFHHHRHLVEGGREKYLLLRYNS